VKTSYWVFKWCTIERGERNTWWWWRIEVKASDSESEVVNLRVLEFSLPIQNPNSPLRFSISEQNVAFSRYKL